MSAIRTFLALCACVVLTSGLGLAQTMESTPIPAVPKPNFSSMNFMIGTWSCSTKSSRRPAPYLTTATYTASPDGWWIDETSVTNPVAWFPHKTSNYDKITFDATTNRWVDVSYGDLGAYGSSTSHGWNGDSIVWHDLSFAPNSDVKSESDTTVTKNSETRMTATSSFTEGSGRTISVVTKCNKKG